MMNNKIVNNSLNNKNTHIMKMKDFKIHIVELGPIKDATIQLAPLMIFTGESSLGKSYVNFLSYYVFDFFGNNGLARFLKRKIEGKKWNKKQMTFNFTVSEMRLWMSDDVKTFMRDLLAFHDLECNVNFLFGDEIDDKITVIVKDNGPLILNDTDPGLKKLDVEVKGYMTIPAISYTDISYSISSVVARILSQTILGRMIHNAFLLPPGRTSLISNSFSVKKMVSNTGMYDRFLHDYDILQNARFRFKLQKDDDQFFISQIKKLIQGDIATEKDETYLVLNNGDKIPISAAASSIRELSPFLFWVKNHNIGFSSVCLEEPEAHAHPEMQYGIADLLVSCVNKEACIQMTTHSDYILTRFNQLIKLYRFQQDKPEAFKKSDYVQYKRQLLNPEDIKAYYFKYSEEKETVVIVEQDLSEGIPFDSFHDVIMRQIKFDDDLNQLTEEDEDK